MKKYFAYFFFTILFSLSAKGIFAAGATFYLSPANGAFQTGKSFLVDVLINSAGKEINAGESIIKFDPNFIKISKITKDKSIFKLWPTEPTPNSKTGTIKFAGGIPANNYKGVDGQVFTIDLTPLKTGTSSITIASSSLILLADGQGFNIANQASSSDYFTFASTREITKIQTKIQKLVGKILLQVEGFGQSWYVDPKTQQRAFLGRPADAFKIMRELGLGISEKSYKSFSTKAPLKLSGRILLRSEAKGEAYYVNPTDLKIYYLGKPEDAFSVMRKLGLGILNKDLSIIPVYQKYSENR